MGADYTPTLGNYTELKPFRYWCQKVLPLVYDDSLSYYELLCKVVDYLNKTMEDVDTLHDDVENLHTAYEELQTYVNTYFDNLDAQQMINNKLDAMAANGTLTALIAPYIPDLVSAWLAENITPTSPAVDSSLSIAGAAADAKTTGDKLIAINEVLEDNFNIEKSRVYDGYNGTNNSPTVMTRAPFILYKDLSNILITTIRINVSGAGTLSIGYYDGPIGSYVPYVAAKLHITNTITIGSTGLKDVDLPHPFSIPEGAKFVIGINTDTATWYFGSNGSDKGFVYLAEGASAFSYSASSIGINIEGYSYTPITTQLNDLSNVVNSMTSNYNNGILYDSYSADNVSNSDFTNAPFILSNKTFTTDFVVTDFYMYVRGAGTVTFGTIKKTDVTVGSPFDPTKVKEYKRVTIASTGLQTVHLGSMVVHTDEYVCYGLNTDTALFNYGNYGTDLRFICVGGNGNYLLSYASVNINLIGYYMDFKSSYHGKTLSILGDSISTFDGYLPAGNETYYPNGTVTSVYDTWWKKLIDALGMSLNVNNSWTGTRVTTTAGSDSAGCGSRAEALGTTPDVIIIWMGINDFINGVDLGTYDGSTAIPVTTTTFREAYSIMLNKVLTAYKSAEVWVCTLPQCERVGSEGFPEINSDGVAIVEFNKAIEELARAFGVKVLDHNRCGLTYQNMSVYNPDELHPNRYGHSLIANNDIRQMDDIVRMRYPIA